MLLGAVCVIPVSHEICENQDEQQSQGVVFEGYAIGVEYLYVLEWWIEFWQSSFRSFKILIKATPLRFCIW